MAADTTIGTSSFMVIWLSAICPPYSSMNQLEREKAPQPQLPDASDVSMTDGVTPSKEPACIICIPFHDSQYCHHHSMSDLASSFRRTKWSRCLGTVERSISLRKNDLHALTTLQACERSPIKERSSLFLQLWRLLQELSASFRCISLSAQLKSYGVQLYT